MRSPVFWNRMSVACANTRCTSTADGARLAPRSTATRNALSLGSGAGGGGGGDGGGAGEGLGGGVGTVGNDPSPSPQDATASVRMTIARDAAFMTASPVQLFHVL